MTEELENKFEDLTSETFLMLTIALRDELEIFEKINLGIDADTMVISIEDIINDEFSIIFHEETKTSILQYIEWIYKEIENVRNQLYKYENLIRLRNEHVAQMHNEEDFSIEFDKLNNLFILESKVAPNFLKRLIEIIRNDVNLRKWKKLMLCRVKYD